MTIASTKPYLVRAIHEWCIDQGLTPHIAVAVDDRVVVPPGYAQDGQIVLNLGPEATNNLVMGNDTISFQARFGGAAHTLLIPMSHVLAIYARENGQGMAFERSLPDPESEQVDTDEASSATEEVDAHREDRPADDDGPDDGGSSPRRGHLKVVK